MPSKPIIDLVGQLFELAGVVALAVGALVACASCAGMLVRQPDRRTLAYHKLRKGLGRAILVGLELLIAADIVRTVAIEPTVQNVLVLGLIVLIRTFLSWSLEVEIDGRWPWQGQRVASAASAPSGAADKEV
jgi:uncharacterized membrane protein